MSDERAELVVEIAKQFIALLQVDGHKWTRGFFRFKSDVGNYGSNASYVTGEGVSLISAMRNKSFYERVNEVGRRLIESFGKTSGVFLLTVENDFDYKIEFEWDDLSKWEISKLDRATGFPVGA